MRCIAKYIGNTEKLGVKPGEMYAVDLNIYSAGGRSPYIWVSAAGSMDYVMPFGSLHSMMREWAFYVPENDEGNQELVERSWMETLYPECGVYAQ